MKKFLRACLGRFRPGSSYQDLLAQRERLSHTIWHWRYPEGDFVPQEKRLRMFRELRKLDRDIERHPDNPEGLKNRAHDAEPPPGSRD